MELFDDIVLLADRKNPPKAMRHDGDAEAAETAALSLTE